MSNTTFQLYIEVVSVEQGGGLFSTKWGESHVIGSRRLELTSKDLFPKFHEGRSTSNWAGTVDRFFALQDSAKAW